MNNKSVILTPDECRDERDRLAEEKQLSDIIIVTGAAGFIGSNVVRALNDRGYVNLLLVDQLGTDDKWKNLVGLAYEDIQSPAEFMKNVKSSTLPEAAAVIHLGACSATTELNADFLLENNYRYSRDLCEWSLLNNCRFV
jgi:ADP-L-glycero-D-manno-heptose 6-epimerase